MVLEHYVFLAAGAKAKAVVSLSSLFLVKYVLNSSDKTVDLQLLNNNQCSVPSECSLTLTVFFILLFHLHLSLYYFIAST